MQTKLSFLFTLLLIIPTCLTWWDTGHMLVANVAKLSLLKEDREAYYLAERLTGILNIFSHELVTNFVESSCWPDDVKGFGLSSMDNWHFIDLPVHLPVGNSTNSTVFSPSDALGILTSCYEILTRWNIKEVQSLETQFEKSMMMRYLVHVLGDIHQPLHASSLFDDQFPKGDMGGNLFLIKFPDNIEITNLHKLFDSGIDKLRNDIKRPLKSSDYDYLDEISIMVMEEHKKEFMLEHIRSNFTDWIKESYSISQEFIYPEISFDTEPSQEYKDKAFDLMKNRIAIGGYRLAELIKIIKDEFNKVKKSGVSSNVSPLLGFLQ